MRDIPIFDSLTHPTIDGTWMRCASCRDNSLCALETEMDAQGVPWAFAVGMQGVGGYSLASYADYIRGARHRVLPVAYYEYADDDRAEDIGRKLDEVCAHGYVGIKLHPRFSSIPLQGIGVREVIRAAASRELRILICTFLYGARNREACTAISAFDRLLAGIPPTSKVLLVHGGDVNVLGMMEVVRPYPHVLLDLSFTLCRYEGSSLDMDIRYLFQHYDRRICVGSDSPQFSLGALRQRFNEFARGLSLERCANIAHRNLLTFAGIE